MQKRVCDNLLPQDEAGTVFLLVLLLLEKSLLRNLINPTLLPFITILQILYLYWHIVNHQDCSRCKSNKTNIQINEIFNIYAYLEEKQLNIPGHEMPCQVIIS